MKSNQIAEAIKVLIASRDNDGADVQPVIDDLFARFEALSCKPISQYVEDIELANTMARLG